MLRPEEGYTYVILKDVTTRILYPAGEPHIEWADVQEYYDVIECPDVRNFNDLCLLKALDREYKRVHGRGPQWFIPYFPFARHDRRRHDGDADTLQLALELVKDMNVLIVDPHSDVAGVLSHIDQDTAMTFLLENWALEPNAACLIPDIGAQKKQLSYVGGYFDTVLQGTKHRNVRTGKLSGFKVSSDVDFSRTCPPVYIIDDICDGGGTFLGLLQALDNRGFFGPATLIVTHGLFTDSAKLDHQLRDRFHAIVTFSSEESVMQHYADQFKANFKHPGAPIYYFAWRDLYEFWRECV